MWQRKQAAAPWFCFRVYLKTYLSFVRYKELTCSIFIIRLKEVLGKEYKQHFPSNVVFNKTFFLRFCIVFPPKFVIPMILYNV